ncbi:MAG: hypothetical protein ABEH83_03025 [Halobacterium sp.]
MRDLVERLYAVQPREDVAVEAADGTRVEGRPSRIDRDEAGIRIEVCPGDRDAPQYRVRADRTPDGWRAPRVERRPIGGDWERVGRLTAVER